MLATIEEIETVNGVNTYTDDWLKIDTKCYYRGNKPIGIIGAIEHDGIIYIAINTIKIDGLYAKMTREMFNDIMYANDNYNIAISFSKSSENTETIRKILSRRNGIMSEYDSTSYIWYNRR